MDETTTQRHDETPILQSDPSALYLATKALDERFNALARVLSKLEFRSPLTDSERNACNVVESRILPGKNVYPNSHSAGTSWVVKYYKGGKQRAWAHYPDIYAACRLADMLITQFNAERTRHKAAFITDDHLNITPDRAATDWANETEIRSMILQLDACLPEIPKGRKVGYKKHSPKQLDEIQNQLAAMQIQLNTLIARATTI